MPKNVQMPDGSVIEFPDNMDDGAISSVLQKQYAKTNSPIPQNVAGLPPGQAPPGLPGAPPVNMKPSDVGQIFGDPGTYAGIPAKHIANMVKGIGGLAAPAQNGGELAASALGPAALPAYRALVQPSIQPLKDTANYAKQGNWEGARQSIINAVPIAGPWGKAVEDEAKNEGGVPAAIGMGTDYAVPEGISAIAGPVGGFLGSKMKSTGSGIMNNTVGALKSDFSHGANPGAGYLEGGGIPALSMKGLSKRADQVAENAGQGLGSVYKAAGDNGVRIPATDALSAVADPVSKLRAEMEGIGGTGAPQSLSDYEDRITAPFAAAEDRGGFTPSELFSQVKKPIADRTRWNDPSMFDLNQARQQGVGAVGGLLTDAVPEAGPLNRVYQGSTRLANRAEERANTGSTPLSTMARKGTEAALGGALGYATHNPLLAIAPLAMDSIPAKSTAAYGLYKGGQAAAKTGEALSNLQGSAYLFPPKKKR